MHARVISSRVMILVTSDAAPQPARARPGRPTEITDDHRVRHAVSALCDAALCGSGSPGTAIKFPYLFFRGVTVTVSQCRAAVKLETVTSKQGQGRFRLGKPGGRRKNYLFSRIHLLFDVRKISLMDGCWHNSSQDPPAQTGL